MAQGPDGPQVRLPPGVFLQASREAEAALVALRQGVGRAKRVADLFAGIGTFTFALAASAGVDAYEQDEAAIAALGQAALATPKLKPVRTFARDLFRAPLSVGDFARYDAVVFDPPRAGAKAQAETASSVPKVVIGLEQSGNLRAGFAHPRRWRLPHHARGPRGSVPVLAAYRACGSARAGGWAKRSVPTCSWWATCRCPPYRTCVTPRKPGSSLFLALRALDTGLRRYDEDRLSQ